MLTFPVESLFGKDPDVAEDVVDDKVRYIGDNQPRRIIKERLNKALL
jgi:hypothetical protein